MQRIGVVLFLLLSLYAPVVHAESAGLCMDGTLLFREDFGGNDPNDPDVSMASVPGMDPSYVNSGNSLGSGHYTIRKEGWLNGIQWHRQDDHTYPDDKTRGYLLEVDGVGGETPFYSKTIEGLCAGSRLTFSAYVVNVHYAGQIQWFYDQHRGYVYPRLKFVLKNPETGEILASESTGDIQPDISKDWATARANSESAEWQLIGMNFTVPEGIESIQMLIYNDVANNGTGNDFALDDIEIRLCLPPVTIDGEAEVCQGSTATLSADFTNDGTLTELLEYKWWHSADSLTWTEMSNTSASLSLASVQDADSGWYKVAVAVAGNIESVNCRALSEPFKLTVKKCDSPQEETLCMDGTLLFREDFGGNDPNDPIVGSQRVPGMDYTRYTQRINADHVTGQPGLFWLIKSGYYHADTTGGRDPMRNHSNWYLQDDHTYPDDKSRGYLLEIDGLGGRAPFYSTVVHDLCPATRLTFSAYVANVNKASNYIDGVHARIYPRLRFELENANDGTLLASHSTGDIPYDSTLTVNTDFFYSSKWYLHGLTFTVPGGVDSIRLTIYNDVESNGAGNDFALDDIEIHLCMPPVSIMGDAEVCENSTTTLTADFTNDGTLAEPLEYKWWHSEDSLTWTELSNTATSLTLTSVQKTDSGWYKVAVAGAGNIENVNCRALSEPFLLNMQTCAPPPQQETLCMDGILLFREDFGGNDPDDPRVSTTPVSGMSYIQATTDVWDPTNLSVRAGKYIVTKSGYCNGDTAQTNAPNNRRSQWFIQDDHTYPNDYTRGYFIEVDGKGDNAVFYTTTIDGLCAGIELTFLAYVANLQLPWYYENQTRTYPRLKFSLLNPVTNELLRTYDTGDIPYDSLYMGLQDWNHSSKWHPIGMNFVVPENINAVTLEIANNATGNNGNDFALDDIEIRLCMIPDTIKSDTIVCDTISQIEWRNKTFAITDTLRDTLSSSCGFDSIYYIQNVETEHCEPPCPEMHYATRDTTVCDTLMPFTWHGLLFNEPGSQTIILKDEQGCDSIEIDYTLSTFHCEDFCLEGKLLFREDFGGNDAGDSEISCAHVSGIANFYTNACQEVRKHPEYGMSTMNYVLTKKGQGNRQWHVQDDHTYPNDYTRGYFLEVDGYGGTIYKTTVNNLYEGMELTFSAYIANLHDSCVIANMRKNYGYTYPRFKFILKDAESNAELATYTTGNILPDITTPCVLAKSALWQLKGMKYVVPEGVSSIQMLINNDVASYDGNDFGIDDIEIRLCYMPAKKIVQDTIICDTIDNIVWRNKIYPLKNELRDTVYDSSGADSIYYILNVTMEHCCPEIKEKTITIGTLCDTLLPYTLYFRDTVLTFKMAGDILLEIQHPQWDCIDSIYILHLDTMHCERLYPIIVNKYNWQLLCHNVRVRELFPELTVTGYQWYKDGTAIPNATEDDYSEQNELQGAFQLRLLMSDGRYVWSEILTIQPSQTQAPSRIRIYNHNGYLFYQSEKETTIPSLPRGLYIIQIEQNGEQRIEKKLIP